MPQVPHLLNRERKALSSQASSGLRADGEADARRQDLAPRGLVTSHQVAMAAAQKPPRMLPPWPRWLVGDSRRHLCHVLPRANEEAVPGPASAEASEGGRG